MFEKKTGNKGVEKVEPLFDEGEVEVAPEEEEAAEPENPYDTGDFPGVAAVITPESYQWHVENDPNFAFNKPVLDRRLYLYKQGGPIVEAAQEYAEPDESASADEPHEPIAAAPTPTPTLVGTIGDIEAGSMGDWSGEGWPKPQDAESKPDAETPDTETP